MHPQDQLTHNFCNVWGPAFLSSAAWQSKEKVISPALMPLGPVVPSCPGEGWGQFCTFFRQQYIPGWHPRPETSTWHLVVTETIYCRAMDPDVASSGSTGQDLTLVSDSITKYSQQAVSHYLDSSELPLFTVPTSFYFPFSSTSPVLTCFFFLRGARGL